MNKMEETHIGGAVLRTPARDVPADPYEDTGIIHDDSYQPFTKWRRVYGITFAANDFIPDQFLEQIALTLKSICSRTADGIDQERQVKVLISLYRYNALLPVVLSEDEVSMNNPKIVELMQKNSICDIIMDVTDKESQTMEVVEHLLHAITDVGFNYAFPEEWGLNNTSSLNTLMNDAVKNKKFNISDYNFMPKNVKERILLQEYAYWIISSYWNIQTPYGHHEKEWLLTTPELLKESQPKAIDLIKKTADTVISVPDDNLLKELGK